MPIQLILDLILMHLYIIYINMEKVKGNDTACLSSELLRSSSGLGVVVITKIRGVSHRSSNLRVRLKNPHLPFQELGVTDGFV